MARFAGPRAKAVFYLAVMLPLWSNYLVRVYSWKLILAKEGVVTWLFNLVGLGGLLDGILRSAGRSAGRRSPPPISACGSCSSISGCPT